MSIAKNYMYNLIYQIITLIMPLITVPYVARVLGSNGVGINAYTNSIIQYFILFGTIGIALYGNRTIAYVRGDKEKLSRTFWGIFYLKLLMCLISFLSFLFFLEFTDSYHDIYLMQSIFLLAAAIDISWLYMGLEEFKKTVIRNLIVKIVGVIFIFIFVNDEADLWKYVLILSLSQLLGNLTLWFYVPKTINFIKVKWSDIKRHLLPSVQLFLPQIAIQIYVVLNKTMLGVFSNTNEVGYFDSSEKIIKLSLAIVTAMGLVMLPRVANTFAQGNMSKVNDYLYRSFDFASYISIPMMFGLAGIANEFVPWFFGPGFSKTSLLIVYISPIIVLIAWSNVLGQQYLMPTGRMKAFTISVSIGAVINLILNLLLIKNYQSVGTAISTVIAELGVTFAQLYIVRRNIDIKKLFDSVWKYLLAGTVMYLIIRLISDALSSSIMTTFIQIFIGIIVYIVLLFFLKSKLHLKLFTMGYKYISKKVS